MMVSRRRRVSRSLIAVLSAILVLGLIFWLHNVSQNRAVKAALQAAGKSPQSTGESSGKPAEKAERKTLVMQTPTAPVAPTTRPAETRAEIPILAAEKTTPAIPVLNAVAEQSLAAAKPAKTPTTSAAKDGMFYCGTAAMIEESKLLEARNAINASVVSGTLSPADLATAKQKLNELNAKVVFSTQIYPDDAFGGTFTVPSGAVLSKIASSHEVTSDLLMRINGITDPRRLRAGQLLKVLKGPFHAAVYKKEFRLELWLGAPDEKGSLYVTSFPVGLGKDDSTPSGVWAVGTKLKNPAYYSPRGGGIIAPDDPKNPLGEYWIGIVGTDGHAVGKTSYGIHGTIDPNSIGKQESMGCVRLKNEDAGMVYEMLIEGQSTVVVKD